MVGPSAAAEAGDREGVLHAACADTHMVDHVGANRRSVGPSETRVEGVVEDCVALVKACAKPGRDVPGVAGLTWVCWRKADGSCFGLSHPDVGCPVHGDMEYRVRKVEGENAEGPAAGIGGWHGKCLVLDDLRFRAVGDDANDISVVVEGRAVGVRFGC